MDAHGQLGDPRLALLDDADFDLVEPPQPKRPCFKCSHWGDGIRDPEDVAHWRPCLQDGKNLWAHRNFACAEFVRAPTLKEAIKQVNATGDLAL